ncbi:hypothetical protein ACS0TY_031945 [Phlomoides rotata]
MGNWVDGNWVWEWKWTRPLSTRNLNYLYILLDYIGRSSFDPASEDNWIWTGSSKGRYKASKKYWNLEDDEINGHCDANSARIFKSLWETWAPRKAISTTWRLLKDRLATKTNLERRGVSFPGNANLCALCNSKEENVIHIFFDVMLHFIFGVLFMNG